MWAVPAENLTGLCWVLSVHIGGGGERPRVLPLQKRYRLPCNREGVCVRSTRPVLALDLGLCLKRRMQPLLYSYGVAAAPRHTFANRDFRWSYNFLS